MAFDGSMITGAVNNYLNSISDTSKLLTGTEKSDGLDPALSGLFEKYLTKAIKDETDGTSAGIGAISSEIGSDNALESAEAALRKAEAIRAAKVGGAVKAGEAANIAATGTAEGAQVRRVDTSIPFPKFDIGSMIAANIASHNRLNENVFSDIRQKNS